jgi:pimeloyl-ACP methyl ester carboxylesterase
LRRCNTAVLHALGLWVRRRDLFRTCKQIEVPICVLLCTADPVSPPEHQLRLLRALPQAHAVMLNVGHLPNFERPRAFARAVRSWLDDAWPRSPAA